ncbi:hypothetical protein [Limnoglobus roseus]|nr:hypothetical protein [Limnoglobus roseus]
MSLLFSTICYGVFAKRMRNPASRPLTFVRTGLIGGALSCCTCFMMTFLSGFTITWPVAGALAIGWHYAGRRPSAILPVLLLAIVIGHAIPAILLVAPDVQRFREIRSAMTDLDPDERLRRPAVPAIKAEIISPSEGESKYFATLTSDSGRKFEFSMLHDNTVDHFVNNPGFGVMRMAPRIRDKDYYLPRRPPISQPRFTVTSESVRTFEHPLREPPLDLEVKHRKTVGHFAFPQGWGWEKNHNQILGFQSHQMGGNIRYGRDDEFWGLDVDGGWKIASVELIGLLQHPKPTVYMTTNLPRMDEAKAAPTRDPDEFEAAGLKAVAGGGGLYFGQSRTEPFLRMVGGIRAAKACASCHGCREGELLGAFSYTLTK